MTVSYQSKLANNRGWVLFKLLFSWRGSIYKAIWPDLLVFLGLYGLLKLIYKLALNQDQKRVFEVLTRYCDKNSNLIPISFVLGFYVSVIMTRWWNQFQTIPWPDSLAVKVSAAMEGQDDRCRLIRRTILRYMNLTYVLTFRKVSGMVMKRFPTMQHIVDAGFMNDSERAILDRITTDTKTVPSWLPAVWAATIAKRAYKEGKIGSAVTMQAIIDSIDAFRGSCGQILRYDWISVPLMYTQVVTWAVYTYFLACIMGRQFLDTSKDDADEIDLYIPIFTILQVFFYIGWLKTAQTLMNPFGEDDDDFEINYMIDRNIRHSYLIVDEVHEDHPEIVKDQYWDSFPVDIPYTIGSEKFKRELPPPGSAEEMDIPEKDLDYASLMDVDYDSRSIYESIPGSSLFARKFGGSRKNRNSTLFESMKSIKEDKNANEKNTDKLSLINMKRKRKEGSITSLASIKARNRTVSENSRAGDVDDKAAPGSEPTSPDNDTLKDPLLREEEPIEGDKVKKPEGPHKLSVVEESNESQHDDSVDQLTDTTGEPEVPENQPDTRDASPSRPGEEERKD